jgi:hypothetical protein
LIQAHNQYNDHLNQIQQEANISITNMTQTHENNINQLQLNHKEEIKLYTKSINNLKKDYVDIVTYYKNEMDSLIKV